MGANIVLALIAACSLHSGTANIDKGSTSINPLSRWRRWAHGADSLRETFTDEALSLLAARRAALARLSTREDWAARQTHVARGFASALGPLPAPLPSSANATATLHINETGIVQHTFDPAFGGRGNFSIRKLTYESRPGFIVTAALWEPDPSNRNGVGADGRRAAVLFASGHSAPAFRGSVADAEDSYQIVINNLCAKGFVVLAYDPPSQGERCMYCGNTTGAHRQSAVGGCTYDVDTGANLGGSCTVEHQYYGRQLHLNNVSTASVWITDGMRALDVLLAPGQPWSSLVDATRVGMAGCSGGGTQTMYLSAVDPRIAASSTACYASTFEVDFEWQGAADAEQQWLGSGIAAHGNGRLTLDKADLSVLRAPKPTQLLLTSNDACFPVTGGRDCFNDAKRAFDALGEGGIENESNLTKFEGEWHHGYNHQTRPKLYSFMMARLRVSGDAAEYDIPPVPVGALRVTPTGSVVADLNSKTVHDLITAFTRNNVATLRAQRVPGAPAEAFIAALPATAARVSGMRPVPPTALACPAGAGGGAARASVWSCGPRLLGRQPPHAAFDANATGGVERWLLPSEGRCAILIDLYLPLTQGEGGVERPVVVLLDRNNVTKHSLVAEAVVQRALGASRGVAVAVVTLCGFGEVGDAFGGVGASPHGSISVDGNVHALAAFVGRSIVGLHAAELATALQFLGGGYRTPTGGALHIAAVAAREHLHAAALHLAATEPALIPALAILKGVASFEAIAMSERYETPSYMDVTGALQHYDLPDLAATLATGGSAARAGAATSARPLLLLCPVGATLAMLGASAAGAAYNFTRATYAMRGAAGALSLVTDPAACADAAAVSRAVSEWVLGLLLPAS
eukprot:g3395.t1